METYSFDGIAAELDRLAAEIVALNTQPFSPVPELGVNSEDVSEDFLAGGYRNPRSSVVWPLSGS